MKAERKIDYRHIICVLITLGFIALGIFRFFGCIGRMIESVRDFGLSIAYYFCEIFEIPHHITPTVNDLPKIPFFDFPSQMPDVPIVPDVPSVPLPDNWEKFKINWSAYWRLWATKENFFGYLYAVGNVLYIFSKVIVIIIPFILYRRGGAQCSFALLAR